MFLSRSFFFLFLDTCRSKARSRKRTNDAMSRENGEAILHTKIFFYNKILFNFACICGKNFVREIVEISRIDTLTELVR